MIYFENERNTDREDVSPETNKNKQSKQTSSNTEKNKNCMIEESDGIRAIGGA